VWDRKRTGGAQKSFEKSGERHKVELEKVNERGSQLDPAELGVGRRRLKKGAKQASRVKLEGAKRFC